MSEVFGLDVSHYQGAINWQSVAAQGRKFVIMKCQYEALPHRVDETFEYNYKQAGVNGLARGVYIFIGSQSIADPVADALSLLGHLKGRYLEYGIWLDYESAKLRALGKERIKDLTKIYDDIFRSAGYYVGIYCNLLFGLRDIPKMILAVIMPAQVSSHHPSMQLLGSIHQRGIFRV